jgi:hypothetical protein
VDGPGPTVAVPQVSAGRMDGGVGEGGIGRSLLRPFLRPLSYRCRVWCPWCTSYGTLAHLPINEGVQRSTINQEASPDDAGLEFLVDDGLPDSPDGCAAIGGSLWDGQHARRDDDCAYGCRLSCGL